MIKINTWPLKKAMGANSRFPLDYAAVWAPLLAKDPFPANRLAMRRLVDKLPRPVVGVRLEFSINSFLPMFRIWTSDGFVVSLGFPVQVTHDLSQQSRCCRLVGLDSGGSVLDPRANSGDRSLRKEQSLLRSDVAARARRPGVSGTEPWSRSGASGIELCSVERPTGLAKDLLSSRCRAQRTEGLSRRVLSR